MNSAKRSGPEALRRNQPCRRDIPTELHQKLISMGFSVTMPEDGSSRSGAEVLPSMIWIGIFTRELLEEADCIMSCEFLPFVS